jgi:D-glycero-D-manno-heptose 1,7-bisphosphate phosphatase
MRPVVQEALPLAYSAQDGTWARIYRRPDSGRKAAIFLDRDGVIVEEVGHLHRIEDVRLMPGAADLLRAANDNAVPVVVVTNQGGLGRGLYPWSAFEEVIGRMNELITAEGVAVDAVYACPFHPEGRSPFAHPSHPSRKPNPGMLIRAAAELDLDLESSWLVGDTVGDIEAARSAGLAGAVHLLAGHGLRDRAAVLKLARGVFRIGLADDLTSARQLIPIVTTAPLGN